MSVTDYSCVIRRCTWWCFFNSLMKLRGTWNRGHFWKSWKVVNFSSDVLYQGASSSCSSGLSDHKSIYVQSKIRDVVFYLKALSVASIIQYNMNRIWVWGTGRMTLRGENRITPSKVSLSATFPTTDSTLNGQASNSGLRFKRLATNCPSCGTGLVAWFIYDCEKT